MDKVRVITLGLMLVYTWLSWVGIAVVERLMYPQFVELFGKLGSDLPVFTQLAMGLSSLYFPLIVAVTGTGVLVAMSLGRAQPAVLHVAHLMYSIMWLSIDGYYLCSLVWPLAAVAKALGPQP